MEKVTGSHRIRRAQQSTNPDINPYNSTMILVTIAY